MSLIEKLKAVKPASIVMEIDGMKFRIQGTTTSRKSELLAMSRDARGQAIKGKADGLFLSECVSDDETGEKICDIDNWSQWGSVAAHITGALMSQILKLCGLDNDDVGRTIKNSETTGS